MASSKLTVYLKAGRKANNREQPHEALANLRDDVLAGWAFYDRWGALHSESLVAPEQAASVRASGLATPYVNLELRDHLRRAWRGDKNSLDFIARSAGQYMRFAWHFTRGRMELVPEDLWSGVCVLFLRDLSAHKTSICENPDCLSPYFIRKRSTQKFCEAGPCVEYGARVRANRWWHTHGDQWRDAKRRENGKGGK